MTWETRRLDNRRCDLPRVLTFDVDTLITASDSSIQDTAKSPLLNESLFNSERQQALKKKKGTTSAGTLPLPGIWICLGSVQKLALEKPGKATVWHSVCMFIYEHSRKSSSLTQYCNPNYFFLLYATALLRFCRSHDTRRSSAMVD